MTYVSFDALYFASFDLACASGRALFLLSVLIGSWVDSLHELYVKCTTSTVTV